jgi:hypothetical protein
MDNFLTFYRGYRPGYYPPETVSQYFWWAVANGMTDYVTQMLTWGIDFGPYASYLPAGVVLSDPMLGLLYPAYQSRLGH